MEQRYLGNNDARVEFSQQQMSFAAALILLLIFCSFMVGYFCGATRSDATRSGATRDAEGTQESPDRHSIGERLSNEVIAGEGHTIVYYASLAHCASRAAAALLVQRIRDYGVEAHIFEHLSTAISGESKPWYEIMTGCFLERDELVLLMQQIKPYISEYSIFERSLGHRTQKAALSSSINDSSEPDLGEKVARNPVKKRYTERYRE
jgi:hypothetical protein